MTVYLISWNVCGLSCPNKRRLILQWTSNFEKSHPGSTSVFCLQETHTQAEQETNLIQSVLGPEYTSIWSSFSSSSRGVCIYTKKINQLTHKFSDSDGRITEGTITINNQVLSIVCLYAPSDSYKIRAE